MLEFIKDAGIKVSLFTGVFVGVVIVLLEYLLPNISFVVLTIIIPILAILGYWIGGKLMRRKKG